MASSYELFGPSFAMRSSVAEAPASLTLPRLGRMATLAHPMKGLAPPKTLTIALALASLLATPAAHAQTKTYAK